VLKLKTSESMFLTHSHTPSLPPASCEEVNAIVLSLRERVLLGPEQHLRLVGLGLGNPSTRKISRSRAVLLIES